MNLQLPLDFERLSEFRKLVLLLRPRQRPENASPRLAEAVAAYLWTRLWVELGLFAQSTNRPGYLTPADAESFELTLEGLFGDDARPLQLLQAAGILQPVSDGPDLLCPWFARNNKHLAGDYLSKEERGNVNSTISRQQKRLAVEAVAQGMLLPPEVFRTRAGEPMSHEDRNRALVLVRNLDNCLGAPPRRPQGYTEGLMADAHAVISQQGPEDLKKFYAWLTTHRERPTMPRTAEHLLRDWELWSGVAESKK